MATERETVGERGEFATSPYQLPGRGWWQVLRRVWDKMGTDNLSVVAAGVAFYIFLALFPGIGVLVVVYGLVADPATVTQQISLIRDVVPPAAYDILASQLQRIASTTSVQLNFGLALSVALLLWSATKGIKAMIAALNIAYEEREQRNFFLLNLLAIVFTICAVLFILVSLAAIAIVPVVVNFLQLGEPLTSVLLLARWPVLALLVTVALGLLYRFGPNRRGARSSWITPGAIAAAVLWLVGSVAFSFYVTNFGDYNKTFGSLAAVVILLFWFYLSSLFVCLGAELNAELEHQTYRDSTVGPARPAGQREAYVADHTAEPD